LLGSSQTEDARTVTGQSSKPEEIHQHSGWLIPLGLLVVIAVLSGLFLLYDLRPGPGPRSGRSADAQPVTLSVRGLKLTVPANYLDNNDSQAGGDRDVLALSALLPDLRGYSPEDARLYIGNAPDSQVVRLLFKGDENDLDAAARLERIYRPYLKSPEGAPGEFGLTQYAFRPDSGYARQDLFAGYDRDRLVLFLCERTGPDLGSPNCQMTGRPVARNLSFSYRFKRAHLDQWREIAPQVDALLARFLAK
jgi:hypothetical protein